MRVLVAVGSKHGATEQIAATIGEELASRGLQATVASVDDSERPADYDAVVIGSSVYAGHWLKPVAEFVRSHEDVLGTMPVWLFSSGPIGDPPMPDEDPVEVAALAEATNARSHRMFAGKLDKGELGLGERAVVRALRAPEGDFRDWDAIRAWAVEIAQSLSAEVG